MRIGIIGAENSHTAAIATVINVERKFAGCSVDYVWGETDAFAEDAAKRGRIPTIVKRPRDMLGKVDAVMCDQRHGKYHLKSVWPFVEAGIPAFVDKPFCYRAEEGKAFLKMARKAGTPVTSSSTVVHYASFKRFKKKMADLGAIVAGSTYGPCDLKSQWGGVFFYGIHQVAMALEAFGYDVKAAQITKNGQDATAQLLYPSGLIVTMNLVKEGCPGFGMSALGEKGVLCKPIDRDKSPYQTEVGMVIKMFKTGVEPYTHEQVLKPVQVLEALEKSVKSGKVEKVAQ